MLTGDDAETVSCGLGLGGLDKRHSSAVHIRSVGVGDAFNIFGWP